MIGPLFAMPPQLLLRQNGLACLLVLGLAVCFIRATASRSDERGRRLRLGLLALLGGPSIAALMAGLVHAFGNVSPLDVYHTYSSFIIIGTIAGCLVGLVFGSTSLLSSNGPERPPRNPNP